MIPYSLEGWNFSQPSEDDWIPWGSTNDARARILATGDGYHVVLVRAEPGYAGTAHVHDHTEFAYVLDGTISTQGQKMTAGDAYAAAIGSTHTDFSTDSGATYLSIFKI